MFRSISNMPISRRLLIAFALTAAIPGIVIVLLGSYYLNALDTRGQAVKTSFDAQSIASSQQVNLESMNAAMIARFGLVFSYIGSNRNITDPSLQSLGDLQKLTISSREANFDQTLTKYENTYTLATSDNMSTIRNIILSDDPNSAIVQQQQQALTTASNHWPAYKRLLDEVSQNLDDDITRYLRGEITPDNVQEYYQNAYQVFFTAKTTFVTLRNDWQTVVSSTETMGKIVTNVGPSQINPIIITTIIAFLSIVLVIISTGFIVNLTITRPLRVLANLTKRIARGETEARARISGRDEIFMVATSMNNMLDNIVRLIQETQAQRDNLQAQVEKLVSEVSGAGEGDLSVQAEVTADALGVLADSFNYMVEELSSLVVRVKMVANEVETSTSAILDRMTQLVETGDNQVRQIEEAAAEIERVAGASRGVADRSKVLTEVARKARRDAYGGRGAVQQAVLGMGRINDNVQATSTRVQYLGERSREIEEVVTVISSIAHQTNRLALDAAIQAAMAGENGKGFGAVAADIRRLAERSKEQTTAITRIVRSVRDDISSVATSMQDTERETSSGTKLTQEAGAALEALFVAVENQAKEIENINDMAVQQLRSSTAAVQIMQSVSETTQQSGLSTRDASQNMQRLARLVEQLRSSVEAFKLRDNQGFFTNGNNINIVEEQDNQMTISGLFRTVSATAQPTQLNSGFNHNSSLPQRSVANSNGRTNSDALPLYPAEQQDTFDWGKIPPLPITNGNGSGNGTGNNVYNTPPQSNGNGTWQRQFPFDRNN